MELQLGRGLGVVLGRWVVLEMLVLASLAAVLLWVLVGMSVSMLVMVLVLVMVSVVDYRSVSPWVYSCHS
jgi:hypothetical protein